MKYKVLHDRFFSEKPGKGQEGGGMTKNRITKGALLHKKESFFEEESRARSEETEDAGVRRLIDPCNTDITAWHANPALVESVVFSKMCWTSIRLPQNHLLRRKMSLLYLLI